MIHAAATVPGFQQLVRLSVLNAGPDSAGINQRGHWGIDITAQAAGVPLTTVRPSIFSVSMLAGAPEIKKTRTWTGLADRGRVALSDTRDVADVLRDEGEVYAAKLRRAGVPVTTVRYDGTVHDFMLLNSLSQTRATRATWPAWSPTARSSPWSALTAARVLVPWQAGNKGGPGSCGARNR